MNMSKYDEAFEVLLKDGTIYIPPKDAIFDFVKAVLQNKPRLAYDLYQDCKDIGEATLVMLSVLYNNAKQVLQVQSCNSKDIAKSTGLTGWQIRNAKECVGKFGNGDLVYLMRLIQKVESGIKAGKMDESIAVDYILVNFMGG